LWCNGIDEMVQPEAAWIQREPGIHSPLGFDYQDSGCCCLPGTSFTATENGDRCLTQTRML
jgi:hypothetical protein